MQIATFGGGAVKGLTSQTAIACPICRSHRREDYIVVGKGERRLDEGLEEFAILRCRRHHVEFADALPDSSNVDDVDSIDQMYGSSADSGSRSRYVDFMDRVEDVVGAAAGTLHDVGCGNGQLLIEARRRGWRVRGNDIAAGVKDRLGRDEITCLRGPLSTLAIPAESCDVLTSFCVLPHHAADPNPDMRAAWRMLRPGGWFVLQLPANGVYRRTAKTFYSVCWPAHPTRLARRILGEIYRPGGHQFGYTSENLTHYLHECGFGDVLIRPYAAAARYTLARFSGEPAWRRCVASIAVHTMKFASEVLHLPNHSIVYARKPTSLT